MSAAFARRLEASYRDRREGEAANLSSAKAAGGDQMELVVHVEKPERGRVDGKRGNDGFGSALKGGHEVLTRNGGDRLLENESPPLALLEETPGADLIGQVDRERNDDPAPVVGVDQ